MSLNVPKTKLFKWTKKRIEAAEMLAEGYTINETARRLGISEKTIDRWKRDIFFSEEIDRLTLMMGTAKRAERIRVAKSIVRKRMQEDELTKKDLLDWLKYMQSETDGIKLGLVDLRSTFLAELSELAGPGSDGAPEEE